MSWPSADGLRVDAGVGVGDVVGPRYDPLLAKLIAHGPDREAARARLGDALDETIALGVTTNRGFLRWLIDRPEVAAGEIDTELIDRHWRPAADSPPDETWQAAARLLRPGNLGGFRLNLGPSLRVAIDGQVRDVVVPAAPPAETAPAAHARLGDGSVVLDVDGRALVARLAPAPTIEAAIRHAGHGGSSHQSVAAPMPGQVLEVRVAAGDQVEAGQVLLVLEAMKMENAVVAPAPARVERVLVEAGRQVQRGEALVELA